jgi:nucleoside-diphosphate-sugar epimerase
VAAALPANAGVRAIDLQLPQLANAENIAGDLRELDFVEQIMAGVTHVVHLAPLYTTLADDHATLDHATRGSYQLAKRAGEVGASRFILASTLDLFSPLWAEYRVDEKWRPRPQPHLDQLCAYLAEVAAREVARVNNVPTLCLRLGEVVDGAAVAGQAYDPRWLHREDAVAALLRSLEVEGEGWQIYHIGAAGAHAVAPVARAGSAPFRYSPKHDFASHPRPAQPLASATKPEPLAVRPIRKVVVFGAAGPLGVALGEELMSSYTVRLTDIRKQEELAQVPAQSPGAPLPTAPNPPHEWQAVDVRDPDQVMAACAGMDAIINVSVLRSDPVDAWLVNCIGAYNILRAAVAHGIKRVVHTGPFMIGGQGPTSYQWDDWVVDDVPARPGTNWVYIPSKLAGQEICRIFAEYYGLEAPTLTFCQFLNPEVKQGDFIHPLTVSWADAANALHCALKVESLPSPYEYMHIGADLPHGVFPNDKAKRLLGWQPRDRFEEYYRR